MLEKAEDLRARLKAAIQEDAQAFSKVMEAFKLPKDTDEESATRLTAIEEATLEAARVPLETARLAVEVMELAAQCVAAGNLSAISDGATGAALARAALTGAGYNVRINITSLNDKTKGEPWLAALLNLEGKAAELEAQIKQNLVERGGMPLP